MDKITCLITTPLHKALALKLGLNPTVVTNLAALHETTHPGGEFTELDAWNLLGKRREHLMETYLAIPNYVDTHEVATERLANTRVLNGKHEIKLWRLPNENPLEFFAEHITGKHDGSMISKLKEQVFNMLIKLNEINSVKEFLGLVNNPSDAYRFLLWHEMSHVLNGDNSVYFNEERSKYPDWDSLSAEEKAGKINYLSPDKLNIEYRATLDALQKLREWRKRNPTKKEDKKPLSTNQMLTTINVVNTFAGFNNQHIKFIASTHTYLIDGKEADISVTQWVHRNDPVKEEEEDPSVAGFLEISSELGNVHDEISRTHLDKDAKMKESYPNMAPEDVTGFQQQLLKLKEDLDKEFPNGYEVYTNEDFLRVAGVILTPEGPKTIAGTMDMLVVDSEGNLHIYDFKTHRANNGVQFHKKTLEGYYDQVALYQALLEANYPELKGKIKTHKLVLYNIKYETPRGSRSNENGSTDYIIKNNQVYIKLENGQPIPIQNHTLEVEGEIRRTYSSGQYMGLVPVLSRPTEDVMGIRNTTLLELGKGNNGKLEFYVYVSTLYKKGDPQKNPNVAYVFTENAQAYAWATNNKSYLETLSEYGEPKLNVSDVRGTNQAGIRTDSNGNISTNAFGIVVKKYQLTGGPQSAFVKKEGQFLDTDEDFKLFKDLNNDMFDRLSNSKLKTIKFPSQMALGKAALPLRFAEWLKEQLENRYNIASTIEENKTAGYEGYGLTIGLNKAPNTSITPSRPATLMPAVGIGKGTLGKNNSLAKNEGGVKTDVVTMDENNPLLKINSTFTPQLRRDRIDLIARLFSDEITGALDEAIAEEEEKLSSAIENLDLVEYMRASARLLILNNPVKGRLEAIRTRTVELIILNIQEAFSEMRDYADNDYIRQQYQNALDNFEYLINLAAVTIGWNENIKLSISSHPYYKGSEETRVIGGEVEEAPQEALEGREEDDDDEEGSRATGNDGWSFKIRMVDPHTSLSKTTKKILSNLVNINQATGDPELDDLGNEKYINELYAHTVLLDELSFMIDDSDFCIKEEDEEGNISYTFPALEKIADKYKWVQLVINELTNNPVEVSAFYADFRKDFIPYWMSKEVGEQDEDGHIRHVVKSIQLNQPTGYESAKNTLLYNTELRLTIDVDSVYDAKGLVKENIEKGKDLLNDIDMQEVDEDEADEVSKTLAKTIRMLGLPMAAGNIKTLWDTADGDKEVGEVVYALRSIYNKAKKIADKEGAHLISEAELDFNRLCKLLNNITETDAVGSFRDGDKTRYSYSAPNALNTQFKMFKSDERRLNYINEEFKPFNWFYDNENKRWKNRWLELIENDEDVRDNMMLKELSNIDNTEYSKWTPYLIKERFVTEYFSAGYNPGSKKLFAYYNYPIFSDSPVAMFIKFIRYTDNYEEEITAGLREVVLLEMERMKLVEDREHANVCHIMYFDGARGKSFCFLPFLNKYVTEDGKTFILKVRELTNISKSDANEFIDSVISNYMREEADKFISEYSEVGDRLVELGIAENVADSNNKLKEYFWNHHFAETLIILLTTTDLAFYKDGTDFQKRYKELYAAGTKLNTQSRYGKKFEKTIYLSDKVITSANYTDIKNALLIAVEKGNILETDMDAILYKFRNITATDALAYRSLKSFRAVLDMMGLWSDTMLNSFDRIQNGEWDMSDFNTVWLTIKPFVYTLIPKDDGFEGKIKVSHLNKNSEFLLLSMHQMIALSMSKSPTLVALNKFMEDNDIDVVQFESAVKAGKQGCIDINFSYDNLFFWADDNRKAWEEIKKASGIEGARVTWNVFKAGNDKLLDEGKISQEEYNKRMKATEYTDAEEVIKDLEFYTKDDSGEFIPDVIHTIPYRDYVVALPTPEHVFDAEAVFGSQFRNLIAADMPDDPNFRVTINGKEYTKELVLTLYNELITENLLDDFQRVLGKYATIESLLKELLKLVLGNAKYGKNLIDSLLLEEYKDPVTGETKKRFSIPLYSPSITNLIQELVTSMFKNAVTKQKINGAACILVSDFGFTNKLQIEYNKDGSVKSVPCMMPWYSKKYLEPLMVTKTKMVNGKPVEYKELDINKVPKDLLEAVGYRIPTEDKYSMANLKIVGFLPQLNGSSIMLPAEITLIAGSDFDVDKLFIMLPEFKVEKYDMRKAKRDFEELNDDNDINSLLDALLRNEDTDVSDILNEAPDNFREWFEKNASKYEYDTPKIRKVKYNANKSASEQSRAARNNMLIDISRGILLTQSTAASFLNPGSFDKSKLAARVAIITRDKKLLEAYIKEKGLDADNTAEVRKAIKKESVDSIDDFLKKYKQERDPLSLDTFVYYHQLNMTGGVLIGMYANNTTMQAKFLGTGIRLKVIPPNGDYKGRDNTFIVDGKKIELLDLIYSPWGERISKNCAEFSAASVDNVKDPVLADLLLNTKTANITGFLLRAGIPINIIGLLFTQPIIKECIKTKGDLSYNNLDLISGLYALSYNIKMNKSYVREISSDKLLDNIIEWTLADEDEIGFLVEDLIAVARFMMHIQGCAEDMKAITRVSRADSPNGAINITLGSARNLVLAVTKLIADSKSDEYRISGLSKAMIANHKVSLNGTKDLMRLAIMNTRMPRLLAFYSLGIELPLLVMAPYFVLLNKNLDSQLLRLYIQAPKGVLKDDMVDAFYKEYIEYMLTESPLFGNDDTLTYDEKRDYYLYQYPSKFLAIKNKPKFLKYSIINKIGVNKGEILLFRSGRMTPMIREGFIADLDAMMTNDDKDPEIQLMAIDLFMYSFYKDGYQFGPNAYGQFFSPFFLSRFTRFMDTLRGIEDKVNTMDFTRFIGLFYNNHWANITYKPRDKGDAKIVMENEEDPNSDIIAPKKIVVNKQTAEARMPYIYIQYNNALYKLKYESSTTCTYSKVPTFRDELGKKYNASEDFIDMLSHLTDTEMIENNRKVRSNKSNILDRINEMDALFGAGASSMDAYQASEDYLYLDGDTDQWTEVPLDVPPYDFSQSMSQLKEPLC